MISKKSHKKRSFIKLREHGPNLIYKWPIGTVRTFHEEVHPMTIRFLEKSSDFKEICSDSSTSREDARDG